MLCKTKCFFKNWRKKYAGYFLAEPTHIPWLSVFAKKKISILQKAFFAVLLESLVIIFYVHAFDIF